MSVEKNAIARTNRALAIESNNVVKIKTTRNHHEKQNFGRFLLVDTRRNTIIDGSNDIAVFPEWETRVSHEFFDECLAEVSRILNVA